MRQNIAILFHRWARRGDTTEPGDTGAPGPRRRDGVVRHLGADDRSSTRVRIVDAALRCLARQGIAKTTVDDIAREAGLSRATLYRAFPGGQGRRPRRGRRDRGGPALLRPGRGHGRGRPTSRTCWWPAWSRRPAGCGDHAALALPARARARGRPAPPGLRPAWTGSCSWPATFAAPFFARWLEPEQAAAGRRVGRAHRAVLPAPARAEADLTATGRRRRASCATFVLPGILALRAIDHAPACRPRPRPRAPTVHRTVPTATERHRPHQGSRAQ